MIDKRIIDAALHDPLIHACLNKYRAQATDTINEREMMIEMILLLSEGKKKIQNEYVKTLQRTPTAVYPDE